MSNNEEPEVTLLTPPHNFAIVKLRDRAFPGIHFQADSTSIILNDIRAIKTCLAEGDLDEASDIVDDLMEQFFDLLDYYEKVLIENGHETPYAPATKTELEKEALYKLGKFAELPRGALIPSHLEKWAKVTKYIPEIPVVKLELTENGGLTGKVKYSAANDQFPSDEDTLIPSKLDIVTSDTEICLFDENLHGWDTTQTNTADVHGNTETFISCKKCNSETFSANIEIGYTGFEGDKIDPILAVEYRDSFESFAVNFTCLSCGKNDHRFSEVICAKAHCC